MNFNTNPSPRTPALQAVIDNYKAQVARIKHSNANDRSKETAQVFGGLKELKTTVNIQLNNCTLISLRTRADLLLSHFMMLRGEDRRKAEFPDLFIVESLHESMTNDSVNILCLRLGHGKVRSSQ
jgi:hypothetical protein